MLVGLACRPLPGARLWRQALAVALGVSGQAFLGIIHPPATGLSLAFASNPEWTWTTFVAVCAGDVVVVVISVMYLNLSKTKQFPLYWLGFDVRTATIQDSRETEKETNSPTGSEKNSDKECPLEKV